MVQPGAMPVVVPLELAPPPPELVPSLELVPLDEELMPPVVPALEPAELVAALVPEEVPTPPADAAPAVGSRTPLIWRQQPLRDTIAPPIKRGPPPDNQRPDTSVLCAALCCRSTGLA